MMELRDFLRSRRARLTPQAAGLAPHPGGRRVPGLRREEVAQLRATYSPRHGRAFPRKRRRSSRHER